jgi:outer membrane protein insertion porin family
MLSAAGLGQASSQKSLDKMPAAARQLIAIKVTGSKRFAEADIAAATGLQIGTAVTDDDFKKAARNLGDTGAFTDIAFSFSFSSAGTKVELHVTDADKFVPAHFQDFVWFTDDELRKRIREHVPMFDGELPLSGRMADEVSDVLQAMLVENAISGHVDYLKVSKGDGPIEAIDYKVSEVLIRVRNIEFMGASEAELPALEAASKRFPDRQYSRARLDQLVQRQLLPVYYARGYLKASFSEPVPKMVKEAGADSDEGGPRNQSIVDVAFAVTPGQQYRLKALTWSGNKEFPTETLQKMVHVELGQPANTVRLGDDLKGVQTLYGSHGFLKAAIKPETEFADAAGMVSIRLDVKEDFVYHMGELAFRGLDNSLTAKLRNIWKMRAGDVYDSTYLSDYLPEAHKLLPPNLDWEVSPHVTANIREKTVDVDLIYAVKAPK